MDRNRFLITMRNDGVLKFTFALFVYATIIVDFLRKAMVIGLLPSGIPLTWIRNIIYIFCFLMVLYDACNSGKIKQIVLFSILSTFVIVWSLLSTTEIAPLIPETILLLFSRFFPSLYLFSCIDNCWEERIQGVVNGRWIIYLYFGLAFANYDKLSGGYMEIGYNLLCPVLITLYYAIKNKKRLIVSVMSVVVFFMCFFCSRGIIFCILLSGITFFAFSLHNMNKKEKSIIAIGLVLICVLLLISYESIVSFIFEKFTFTRTVQQLLNGEFFSDSSANARMRLYGACIDEIRKQPFAIRGILSDRVLLSSSSISGGYYAHNFFIEIIYQFGIIIGGIIVIWYIVSMIRSFKKVLKSKNNGLCIIYSSCAAAIVPYMMVSGSYLTEATFWFLFGTIAAFSKIEVVSDEF